MKNYTDLDQSRKLTEILPLESADMCYPLPCEDEGKPLLEQGGFGSIPCWSLTALLNVLPKGTNISNRDAINKLRYSCWNDYDITYADNPVDACYEMIIKLNELKLL